MWSYHVPFRRISLLLLPCLIPTLVASAGDLVPPTVLQTATTAGLLEECDTVREIVFSTRFSFSEPVQNPEGHSEPVDATNPESYLLVLPGEDGEFQTTSCVGGADPMDERVTINAVFFNVNTNFYVAQNFNRLVDGQFRLFACAESIRDLSGNRLDGDGDGVAGDDFQRIFRVDQVNQIRNGHFDCDLHGWDPVAPGFELDLLSDAGPTSVSGSIKLADPPQSRSQLEQCVQVGPNGLATFFARLRPVFSGGGLISFTQSCEIFRLPGCQGDLLGQVADTYDLFPSGGLWIPFLGEGLQIPPLSLSALCRFTFDDLGGLMELFADDLFFDGGAVIFRESMEAGGLGHWQEPAQ